jgi:hypothetical protein
MDRRQTMMGRHAGFAATLFAGLFTLSGVASADKLPKEFDSIMKETVHDANGVLGGLWESAQGRTVPPGCKRNGGAAADRGSRPPGAPPPAAAADPSACEKWPKHDGYSWGLEQIQPLVKDRKGSGGKWKFVSWKGTTPEGIDFEVTFQVSEGGAVPWRKRLMYKGDVVGTTEASALPGPND